MIAGIGIDIVQIKRMDPWLENNKLLEKYFHPDEIAYAFKGYKTASQSLAARFAAKEAFGKAMGTGLKNMALKDIVVKNSEDGKPEIILTDTAKKAFEESGARKIFLSLSHEKEYAAAMVVLESPV
ncbi:MAG: holo-ACP synthase [Treponema sp.]|nr:holo-ACP synthase [Treponema sp.]